MKSFLNWIEESSLSEPEHKKGEYNMSLDKIVERRIKSIIMDLESSEKGTQEEILESIVKYAEKMGIKRPEPQEPQMQDPQMNQDPQIDQMNQMIQAPQMTPQTSQMKL